MNRTSGWTPRRIAVHATQSPQPSSWQMSAHASARAAAVLPEPDGPKNRYAWLVAPSAHARARNIATFG
jgi:hypothetical protein